MGMIPMIALGVMGAIGMAAGMGGSSAPPPPPPPAPPPEPPTIDDAKQKVLDEQTKRMRQESTGKQDLTRGTLSQFDRFGTDENVNRRPTLLGGSQ